MLGNSKIGQYTQDFSEWFLEMFWTEDALYQGIIILFSYVLATLLYSVAKIRLKDRLAKLHIPAGLRAVLDNLSRVLTPTFTLGLIFFLSLIAESDLFDMDTSIAFGVMKLLLAWIIIRILVQFIHNQFVRNLFAVSIWAVAALSIFGILDETSAALDAVGFNIGTFRLSALVVIKGIVSLFLLLYLAVFISTFAERRIMQIKEIQRSSQVLIAKIIRITLIVLALLIGVSSAGIDLSIFAIFSGAVGLGVGFGLQKVISNLFSGLLLLMDKSIVPGDVIEMDEGGQRTFGWVNFMGARYTEIITRDNKSYLIPNEDFITQRVVNWSHGNTLIRLEVDFHVSYDSDPHQVKAIAEEVAAIPDRCVKEPAPVCHLVEFGDNGLKFKLRFWIKDAEKGVVNMRGAVMLELWDAFRENGIKIPYPHREVFIHEKKAG